MKKKPNRSRRARQEGTEFVEEREKITKSVEREKITESVEREKITESVEEREKCPNYGIMGGEKK